jgi:hypothetical protein
MLTSTIPGRPIVFPATPVIARTIIPPDSAQNATTLTNGMIDVKRCGHPCSLRAHFQHLISGEFIYRIDALHACRLMCYLYLARYAIERVTIYES